MNPNHKLGFISLPRKKTMGLGDTKMGEGEETKLYCLDGHRHDIQLLERL